MQLLFFFQVSWLYNYIFPVELYLNFEKSSWKSQVRRTGSILKLIFAGYKGNKNPVWNRLKMQFIKLDFSKLIFRNQVQINRGIALCPEFLLTFLNDSEVSCFPCDKVKDTIISASPTTSQQCEQNSAQKSRWPLNSAHICKTNFWGSWLQLHKLELSRAWKYRKSNFLLPTMQSKIFYHKRFFTISYRDLFIFWVFL